MNKIINAYIVIFPLPLSFMTFINSSEIVIKDSRRFYSMFSVDDNSQK